MFNKKKKIIFQPYLENIELVADHPSPGYRHVPNWYKKQKLYSNNENKYFNAFKKSLFVQTYKMCTPLVDSITSGYMITLPADIIVVNKSSEGYSPHISWNVSFEITDTQSPEVLGNYPSPEGFFPQLYRWNPEWIIKTPAGYSLWVTHPSHRYDLPFFTLNGFVDTDKHPNKLLFPFFIKNGFEGIIEKGTPIVQIIPIKRDSWITKLNNFNKKNLLISADNVNSKFERFYKHNYWTSKKYE